MISLSVNVNKVATLRNSRGGDIPNLITAVGDLYQCRCTRYNGTPT